MNSDADSDHAGEVLIMFDQVPGVKRTELREQGR
jgi:hypothetical protein